MTFDGTGNTIVGSSDSLTFGTGSSASITGTGDTVTASGDALTLGNNTNVTLSGTGDTITAASGDVISGSNLTIDLSSSNVSITITGSYDTVVSTGTGDTINVGGTYDSVNASSSAIDFTNGTNTGDLWLGTSDQINGGSPITDTVYQPTGYSPTVPAPTTPAPAPTTPAPAPTTPAPTVPSIPFGGGSSGYAGAQSKVTSAVGSHLSLVVQKDLLQGDTAAAAKAETEYNAFEQSLTSPEKPGPAAVQLTGTKWNQTVITWSLADSPGPSSAPFSGYMSSTYAATVQGAFNTWAAQMPGVTFKEVLDSSQSDIRIGFGNLNSPTTSLIGDTTLSSQNGQMQADNIIRIENPAQNPLVAGADGQLTYSGTDATLLQVLTHEIGHTLGLADNADPNSIMYYILNSNNRTLDSTDLAGMQLLHSNASATSSGSGLFVHSVITGEPSAGNSRPVDASLNSLIAAMGSFAPPTGLYNNHMAANDPMSRVPLLAAGH